MLVWKRPLYLEDDLCTPHNNHNVKPTVDLQKIKKTDSKHDTVENNQFTKNSSNKGENKRPTKHPGNNEIILVSLNLTIIFHSKWTKFSSQIEMDRLK